MHRCPIALVLVVLVAGTVASAAKIDKRLATVKKAYITIGDDLESDDRRVAMCLTERLSTVTPLESVKSKDEADVVLTVKANIPGAGRRYIGYGSAPSADLDVRLIDGTKLWADGVKNRKSGTGLIGASRADDSIACGLADRLASALLDAMKKARDGK